jgi:endonuclease YncB( thermonuclease family)
MKQSFYLLLILLLLATCQRSSGKRNISGSDQQYDYSVRIVGVTDGDTFTGLTRDSIEIRFRIHGIDAPEKKQPYGQRSKQYLSDLIYNKMVGIIVQKKRDRYGRPVVWVYTPDGKDVSAEMIRAGLAWHYKYFSDDLEYALLEIEARKSKVGLWSDPHPVSPWETRRK